MHICPVLIDGRGQEALGHAWKELSKEDDPRMDGGTFLEIALQFKGRRGDPFITLRRGSTGSRFGRGGNNCGRVISCM